MPLVKAIIKERTRDEWLKRLDKAGVPSGAIRTVGEVCDSEVLKARDMVAEMQHPSAGTVKAIEVRCTWRDTAGSPTAPLRGSASIRKRF